MDIAKIIDHTLLKPEAPLGEYTQLARDGVKYRFSTICINSFHVPLMSSLLHSYVHTDQDLKINVASTIGFPFGTSSIESKVEEMKQAFNDGAVEFDAVINLSAVKTGDWLRVRHELEALRAAVPDWLDKFHPILKVILEVGLLTEYEIKKSAELCIETNCDFLKTSTGFNIKLPIEKTTSYVQMLKEFSKGTKIKVKASGGIKRLDDLNLVLAAGADRVGTSNSVQILDEILKTSEQTEGK